MPLYKHHRAQTVKWNAASTFRALVSRQNELETAIDTYRRAQRVQNSSTADPAALRFALRNAVKRLTVAQRMQALTGAAPSEASHDGAIGKAGQLDDLGEEEVCDGATDSLQSVGRSTPPGRDSSSKGAVAASARDSALQILSAQAASGRRRAQARRRALWNKLNSARGGNQTKSIAGIISDLHDIADLGALSSQNSGRAAQDAAAMRQRSQESNLDEAGNEQSTAVGPLRQLDDDRGYYYRQALNEAHFVNFLRDCGLLAHNGITPVFAQRLFARHATVHRAEAEVVHARRRFHEHVNGKGALPTRLLFAVSRACGLDIPQEEVEDETDRMPSTITWSRFYRWFDERRRLEEEYGGNYDHDGLSPGSAREVLFSAMDAPGFLDALKEVAGVLFPPSRSCDCSACTKNTHLETHGASSAGAGAVGHLGIAYLGLGGGKGGSQQSSQELEEQNGAWFVPWNTALHDSDFSRAHLSHVEGILLSQHVVPAAADMEMVGQRGATSPCGSLLTQVGVRNLMCDFQSGLQAVFVRYASTREGNFRTSVSVGSSPDMQPPMTSLGDGLDLGLGMSYVALRRMMVDFALLPDLVTNTPEDGFLLLSLAVAAKAGDRVGQHHRHVYYSLPATLTSPRRCLLCGRAEYRLATSELHRLMLAFRAWDGDGDGFIRSCELQDFCYAVGLDVDVETSSWHALLEAAGAHGGMDALVGFDALVRGLEAAQDMALESEMLHLSFPEFVHFMCLLGDTTLIRAEFSGMLSVDSSSAMRVRFLLTNVVAPLFEKVFGAAMRHEPPPLVLYKDNEFPAVQNSLDRMLVRTQQLYCRLGGAMSPTTVSLQAFRLWCRDVGLFSSLPSQDLDRVFRDAVFHQASSNSSVGSGLAGSLQQRSMVHGSGSNFVAKQDSSRLDGLSVNGFLRAVELLLRESFALGQRSHGLLDMQAYSLPIAIHTGLTPEGFAKRALLERLNLLFSLYQPSARQGNKRMRSQFAISSPGDSAIALMNSANTSSGAAMPAAGGDTAEGTSPHSQRGAIMTGLQDEGHLTAEHLRRTAEAHEGRPTTSHAALPSASLMRKSMIVSADEPHILLAGSPVDASSPHQTVDADAAARTMLMEHAQLLAPAEHSRVSSGSTAAGVEVSEPPTPARLSAIDPPFAGEMTPPFHRADAQPAASASLSFDADAAQPSATSLSVGIRTGGRGIKVAVRTATDGRDRRGSTTVRKAAAKDYRKRVLHHSVLMYLSHAISDGVAVLDPDTLSSILRRQQQNAAEEDGSDSDVSEGAGEAAAMEADGKVEGKVVQLEAPPPAGDAGGGSPLARRRKTPPAAPLLTAEHIKQALPHRSNDIHQLLHPDGESAALARKVVGSVEWRRAQLSRWLSQSGDIAAAAEENDMTLIPRVPVVHEGTPPERSLSSYSLRGLQDLTSITASSVAPGQAEKTAYVQVALPKSRDCTAAAASSELALWLRLRGDTPGWLSEQYSAASPEELLFRHNAVGPNGSAFHVKEAVQHSAVAGKTTVLKSRQPVIQRSRRQFLEARQARLRSHIALLERMHARALTAEAAIATLKNDPLVEEADMLGAVARAHALRRTAMSMVYHRAALASYEEKAAVTAEKRVDEELQRDDARLKKTLVRLHRLAARSELQRLATDRIGEVLVKAPEAKLAPRGRRGSVMTQWHRARAGDGVRGGSPMVGTLGDSRVSPRLGSAGGSGGGPISRGGATYIPADVNVADSMGFVDSGTSVVPLSISKYTLSNAIASDGAVLLNDQSGSDVAVRAALLASQRQPLLPFFASPAVLARLRKGGKGTGDGAAGKDDEDLEAARVNAYMTEAARLAKDAFQGKDPAKPSAKIKAAMAASKASSKKQARPEGTRKSPKAPKADGEDSFSDEESEGGDPRDKVATAGRKKRRRRRKAKRVAANAAAQYAQQDRAVAALVHTRTSAGHEAGLVREAGELLKGEHWRTAWRKAQHGRREENLVGHPSRVTLQEKAILKSAAAAKRAKRERVFERGGVGGGPQEEVAAAHTREDNVARITASVKDLRRRHQALRKATEAHSVPSPTSTPKQNTRAPAARLGEDGLPVSSHTGRLTHSLSSLLHSRWGEEEEGSAAATTGGVRALLMGAQHTASTDYIVPDGSQASGVQSRDEGHSAAAGHRGYVQASIGSLASAASQSGFALKTSQQGTDVSHPGVRTPAGLPHGAVNSPGAAFTPPASVTPLATPWARPPQSDATMRIAPSPGMGVLLKGMARRMGKWEAQTASLVGNEPSPVDKLKAQRSGRGGDKIGNRDSQQAVQRGVMSPTPPPLRSAGTTASRGSTPAPARLSKHMDHLAAQMHRAAAGGDAPVAYAGKRVKQAHVMEAPVPALPMSRVLGPEGGVGGVQPDQEDLWGSSSAYRTGTPPSKRVAEVQDADFDDSAAEGRKLEESYEDAYALVAQRRAAAAGSWQSEPASQSARPVPRAARALQASLSARHPEHSKEEHVFGRVNALFGRATDAPIPHRPETRGQRLNAQDDDSWKWMSSPAVAQRGDNSGGAGGVMRHSLSLQALNSAGKRKLIEPQLQQSELSRRADAAVQQATSEAQAFFSGLKSSSSSSAFASAVRRAEARERTAAHRQQALHAERLDEFSQHLSRMEGTTDSSASLASTARSAPSEAAGRASHAKLPYSGRSWRDSVEHVHPGQMQRAASKPQLAGTRPRATYKPGVQVPVELVAMRAQRRYTEAKMQDVYRRLIKQAITSNRTPAVLTRPQEVSTMLHGALSGR